MTPRLRTCLAALALTAAGCAGDPLQPLPLDITITADMLTAAPLDSITFEIRAQGGFLLGVSVDWGDGTSRIVETRGARTLEAEIRHAYAASGVYVVSAAVDDAGAGQKTATPLNVTIQ